MEAADARATLEQTEERATRAQREAEERHALELATAASHAEGLRREFDASLEQARAGRAADAGAAAQRLAEREAELGAMLADGATSRSALEARLDEVQLALQRAEQLAEGERVSAGAREQSILDELARETGARTSVEHNLNESRAESARVRHRLLAAASALRRRTTEHRAQLEAQFAEERSNHERRLGAREETIRQVELERDTLRQALDAMRGKFQALGDSSDNERREFERVRSNSESEIQRLSAEHDQARQSLEHLRDAFNTLERVSSEHALERARLESVVADLDAQTSAQEATHLAAEQAAKRALRQVEETLRQTVESKNNHIGGLERRTRIGPTRAGAREEGSRGATQGGRSAAESCNDGSRAVSRRAGGNSSTRRTRCVA